MKLEQQCCSFEQAKRLKELGVVQKSEFIFFMDAQHLFRNSNNYIPSEKDYCAFTVAELGFMLPPYYPSYRSKGFICTYMEDSVISIKMMIRATSEAQCRAGMLIHLLETNKTTPEKVNERLSSS